MINNPKGIDYSVGVNLMLDGTIQPKKIGVLVHTVDELLEIRGWKKRG